MWEVVLFVGRFIVLLLLGAIFVVVKVLGEVFQFVAEQLEKSMAAIEESQPRTALLQQEADKRIKGLLKGTPTATPSKES